MRNSSRYLIAAGFTCATLFAFFTVVYTIEKERGLVRRKKSRDHDNRIAPVVANPHIKPERKLSIIAAQVDSISEETVQGSLAGKNSPYFSSVKWSFFAEALYMRANEEGLEFTLENEKTNFIGKTEVSLDNENLKFEWNWGCRLGFGHTFPNNDSWDLLIQWTNYHAHAGAKKYSDENSFLLPAWYPAVLGKSAVSASSHWKLHYNTLDLELGRDYFISSKITMRPHFGLRGAWINQDYHAKYLGNLVLGGRPLTLPTKMEADNDFDGGGVRAGALSRWFFYRDKFSVIGKLSASLIYGRFRLKQEFDSFDPTISGMPVEAKLKTNRRDSTIRSNIEGGLGFQYDAYTHSKNHIYVTLLYEILEWFQQNELTTFATLDSPFLATSSNGATSQREDGNLGIQGLSLTFGVDF